MCDILIALPEATTGVGPIFGKNSDRPANECQVASNSRDEKRPEGGVIPCAFVEVPEEGAPLATLGCRPHWCWGYETGMNEAGVVGGNTAIYTRSFWQLENQQQYGLTGMELLRFGLERGPTAEAAVLTIARLLETHGQWAPAVTGKHPPEACYENAFLLADYNEAWILETTGRRWAARRLTEGTHALSNQLTIRDEWTLGSDDLTDYAIAQGWWPADAGPLDFALAFSDHEHYARQVSHIRWRRTCGLLEASAGEIGIEKMMAFLRDHYEDTFLGGPQFNAYLPDFLTVCMHDSPAAFTWGNTVTSVVVELNADAPTSTPFWCCYQPPCSGTYLPLTIAGGVPETVSAPGTAGLRSESPLGTPKDAALDASLWWRTRRLVAAVSNDPARRRRRARALFDSIESKSLSRVRSVVSGTPHDRATELRRCADLQLQETETALSQLETEWNMEPKGATR